MPDPRHNSRLPLVLSIKREVWRDKNQRLAMDGEYKAAREQALARDRHTCRYCGWTAEKWQEAHHQDNDHTNNDPDNLVTACAWCHAVHHPGFQGMHQLAVLAVHPDWPRKTLPEQWRLNHLFRTALALPDDYYDLRDQLEEFFTQDCADAAEHWLGTSDPMALGNILRDIVDEETYDRRHEWLAGVRLIPQPRPPVIEPTEPSYEIWQRELTRRKYWIEQLRHRVGTNWKQFVQRQAA